MFNSPWTQWLRAKRIPVRSCRHKRRGRPRVSPSLSAQDASPAYSVPVLIIFSPGPVRTRSRTPIHTNKRCSAPKWYPVRQQDLVIILNTAHIMAPFQIGEPQPPEDVIHVLMVQLALDLAVRHMTNAWNFTLGHDHGPRCGSRFVTEGRSRRSGRGGNLISPRIQTLCCNCG